MKKGHVFESDTDTEIIAKLAKHIYDSHKGQLSFRELCENVVQQLVSTQPIREQLCVT